MTHDFKHPNHYKKMKEENKDFLEEIEKDQKILEIGLKESRRAKKERPIYLQKITPFLIMLYLYTDGIYL